jgi:hypothetical protein
VLQVPAGEDVRSRAPVDNNGVNNKHSNYSIASPNGIFKSIFSPLTRKSPRSSAADALTTAAREEQWKIAVAELSHKLIQAMRKRDEAVLEASRLKHTMAELEKKLNKLEIHRRHLLPRLHARTFGRVKAYCRCFTSRRTSDGVSDGVKGFGDRVDEHDEELVGDEVRKRGRGVWSFFWGKHGWRVKSSYSMHYSNPHEQWFSISVIKQGLYVFSVSFY